MLGNRELQFFIDNMKHNFNMCRTYRRACIRLQELKGQYKVDEQIQQLLTIAFHYSRFGTGGA